MRIKNILYGVMLILILLTLVSPTLAETRIITTLLPKSDTPGEDNLLRISADKKYKSICEALLTFDLGMLPESADIKNVTLRLVGNPGDHQNPQFVQIFAESQKGKSIGSWTTKPIVKKFIASSELPSTIKDLLNKENKLVLTLSSSSELSDWKYYSLENYDNTSSFKPRLIIEYEVPGIQESQTTERTDWKFYGPPKQVKVKRLLPNINDIISNPVFYKNGIYLFTQTTSEETDLSALHTNGREMWKKSIKITPASHAAVTDTGQLYSVGESRIVRYDLEKREQIESKEVKDLKLSDPPTLGPDGSLYFVRSGYGDIYNLNPNLEELWKYPSMPNQQGANKVSRIVLSPDAQRYAYAMILSDQDISGVRINTADGETILYKQYAGIDPADKTKSKQYKFGDQYTGFHRPVVVRGPEQDYVFLSAYSQNNGILAAYSGDEGRWSNSGTISSPIADKNGDHVLVVQSGKLKAYKKFNGELACSSRETDLAATSNLVMDGEDNVYFWNNGTLYGYKNDCTKFLKWSQNEDRDPNLPRLPREVELMFAPDGTMYAFAPITETQTSKQSLYSITPRLEAFTLREEDVHPDTIYSADTITVEEKLELSKGTRIMLKAEKGIAFGTGFRVKKGASLICKTGF